MNGRECRVSLPVDGFNRGLSETCSAGPTIFEPQSNTDIDIGILMGESSNGNSASTVGAPEKKLTLFALRLAILEKAATGLGTLGFIWATVVLLGGFAITLDKTDFWFITIILLIEGTRIFSRSHELEWQHQTTWSITSFRAPRETNQALGLRRWTASDVPLLPWLFIARNVSKLLYWLQLLSATTCVLLSSLKLLKHNYGEVEKGDTDKRNRQAALNVFYSLALAEALLFLMEKCYWEWKVTHCKLLEEVAQECQLGASALLSIRRFFYDAYSRCIEGSIFDGLKMDVVSFAMDLLCSNSPDEQLIGATILRQFSLNHRFSDDTLQKIGTTLTIIERLVEMLNWTDPQDQEMRKLAAEILSKLAGKKQNSLRVAEIPGAMESISSLLQTSRISCGAADEIGEKEERVHHSNYDLWTFNHLGLVILKKLARNHDNCGKIGNTRGLLPKIIDFTHAGPRLLKDENVVPSRILTVKRSLQVMKMLASTTGATGEHLRKEMSEIVFTVSNIRDIMRHGEKHPLLQKLGIEILTSLALEADATERIGGTGGVLKELFNIFFQDGIPQKHNHVRIAAGEALAMLVLESENNCHRVLKLGVLERLVGALEVPLIRVNAGRILTNLCMYSGGERLKQLEGVAAAAPTVVRAIMSPEVESKLQEVMVGVAAHVFRFMTPQESSNTLEKAGIKEAELGAALVRILRNYKNPSVKVPRIRRFAIQVAIWMMGERATNIQTLRELGMEKELEGILESTAEIESFNIFSGTVGLSRHKTTLHSLVETALQFLAQG